MKRLLVPTLLVWLVAGAVGAGAYVSDYARYRGFPPPVTPAGIKQGRLVTKRFQSRALGERRSFLAYLPPGYDAAAARGRRFPVLYLLHAPPGKPMGYVQAGAINVRADILIAQRRIKPMIIVMPDGRSGSFANDTEWANARAGRYESFVLDTVRAVDGQFSTVRSRVGRGIGGLSAGAYGATNIALHNPSRFGMFESWSGYYEQTPTYAFTGASATKLRANSPSSYVSSLGPALRRYPMRAYLYQGSQDGYPVHKLRSFARQLRGAGARVTYSVYSGGHNWRLWRAQLPHMLQVASQSFQGAR